MRYLGLQLVASGHVPGNILRVHFVSRLASYILLDRKTLGHRSDIAQLSLEI